jgi:hypothetical protein
MNRKHRVHQLAGILAALSTCMIGLGAVTPAAFADRVPPPGGSSGSTVAPVRVITTGGMAGWQIAVIALAAALVAATAAVVLDRALWARRKLPATAS